MTRTALALSSFALAASVATLGFGMPTNAHADSTLACAAMSTGSTGTSADNPQALQIIKTRPLYRFQDKPYLRIPEGAAVQVRAPRGVTIADMHNLISACARGAQDARSPFCVAGASIHIERSGGNYVVEVTSDVRSSALEIQKRAERLSPAQ